MPGITVSVGDKAVITGLQRSTHLNNSVVRIVGHQEHNRILVEPVRGTTMLAVKLENLRIPWSWCHNCHQAKQYSISGDTPYCTTCSSDFIQVLPDFDSYREACVYSNSHPVLTSEMFDMPVYVNHDVVIGPNCSRHHASQHNHNDAANDNTNANADARTTAGRSEGRGHHHDHEPERRQHHEFPFRFMFNGEDVFQEGRNGNNNNNNDDDDNTSGGRRRGHPHQHRHHHTLFGEHPLFTFAPLFFQTEEDMTPVSRGAGASAINALERFPSTSEHTCHSCPICQDNIGEEEKLIRMPCGHIFHEGCLLPWLEEHNTCPTCRHELPSVHEEGRNSERNPQPGEGNQRRVDEHSEMNGPQNQAQHGTQHTIPVTFRGMPLQMPLVFPFFQANSP